MNMAFFRKLLPHVAVTFLFLIIASLFFLPLIEGKVLRQSDITHFKGVSKAIADHREQYGEEPLWMDNMFGGMPAYTTSVKNNSNLLQYFDPTLLTGIPGPIRTVFWYMLGIYLLLLSLRVDYRLAFAGAIAFAFTSYNIQILEAGHNTKAFAIAMLAPLLMGVLFLYRRQYLVGALLTALFGAIELRAGHYQITYYFVFMMVVLGLFMLVEAARKKTLPDFLKAVGIMAGAALLGVGPSLPNMLLLQEYTPESIRGKSELTIDQRDQTEGLSTEYITAWSNGLDETFTLLVPNYKGTGSGPIGKNDAALDRVDNRYRQIIQQLNGYFGDQPFISGGVYAGAVVIFLFVLGLFILEGTLKWAMLSSFILMLLISWGRHMMGFTEFMIDVMPLYNKFRAVTMALALACMIAVIVAFLAASEVMKDPTILKRKRNGFFAALGLTGGFLLITLLAPDLFNSFFSPGEIDTLTSTLTQNQFTPQQIALLVDQLREARIGLVQADALRSLVFVLLTAGLVWAAGNLKMFKPMWLAVGLVALVCLDSIPVASRSISDDKYVAKRTAKVPYPPTAADQQILQDQDPNFRVYNTSARLDQDSRTSYYHKSLGGYNAAKPRRYQEMLDYHVSQGNLQVINMMNTKYIIGQNRETGQLQARQNPGALGNAWPVAQTRMVANADSAIQALGNFQPRSEAIVEQKWSDYLNGFTPQSDPGASVRLSDYKMNHLTYETTASSEQFIVFSEAYYKAWQAYVDGAPVEHIPVNYVLRGMRVPAGQHTIEFRYESTVFTWGSILASLTSGLILLAAGYLLWQAYRGSEEEQPSVEPAS